MNENWLQAYILLAFRIRKVVQATYGDECLVLLHQVSQMLEGVWHNAAILLDEGRSDQDVAQYFMRYMLVPEDRAISMVALLKHPIWGRNLLTYASGYRLMQRHLQGPDKITVFRHFLTEQITPSQLESKDWTIAPL